MDNLEERVAKALYEIPLFASTADAGWCDYYGRPSWERVKSDPKGSVHAGEPDRDDYMNAARTILRVINEG